MWLKKLLSLSLIAYFTVEKVHAQCESCVAGEYYEACSESCVSCIPGNYCNGGCTDPQPCAAGSFYPGYGADSPACDACPDGFFSNIPGSINCTACPAGHQCLDKSATPTICPRGTYSTLYSLSCSTCPAGAYNTAEGSSSCMACQAGYACPSPSADPVQCPIGSYSTNEATSCEPCPAGFSCSSTAADANLLCPDGSYSLENWAYCVVCPAGHACSETSSLPVECDPGTYSLGGEAICRECPDGRYQPSAGASSCSVCPAGFSCLDKTAEPVECSAGTFSLEAADSCSACSFGQYAASGAGECQACPAGYTCAVNGTPVLCGEGFQSALGEGFCTICETGLYSRADRTACLACEAGFECPDPTAGPEGCAPGYFSLGGSVLSCTPCPAGSYCSNTADAPLACPSGTYAGMASTSCAACPAGFQCTNPASPPVVCDTGYYSLGGLSLCIECPAGSECPQKDEPPVACDAPRHYATVGSTVCSMCEAGMHCEDGRSSSHCSVGLYAAEGDGVCQLCPAGSFCPTPSDIYGCPAGMYSLGGAVNCTSCPAGYACPTQTSDPVPCAWGTYSKGGQVSCTDCPPGSACPSTKTDYIVPCDLGFYPDNFRNNCIPCAPGMYCPDPVTRAEITCEDGTYSPGAQSTCSLCPAGYSCDIYGAAIIQCDSGQYSREGDSFCYNCPAGYACPNRETNSEILCRAGTYSLGGQAACTECPVGNACPSTTTINDMIVCSNGGFSTGSQTSCTICPAGYECPSTTSDSLYPCSLGEYSTYGSHLCSPCLRGYYCPDPANTPILCPFGFYSESGWSECAPCPAGYECSNPAAAPALCAGGTYSAGASTSCLPCAAGYLCPSGSTNPTPPGSECPVGGYCLSAGIFTNCPSGTYGTIAAGQSEEHACSSCLEGYYCPSTGQTIDTILICPARAYCPAGSSSPTYCPRGSTSLSIGQSTSSTCEPCARSTYCPNAGSTEITCPEGYYCPIGTYSPISCPAGTYGDAQGYFTVGQCKNCTVGSYCLPGSTSPLPCSAGTYMPFSGSSLSSCMPCEAGYACPSPGMSHMTTPCAAGYYCAPGTISATQTPCPAGTYSDAIDLTSALSCAECPAGFRCAAGSTSDLILNCRVGRYCPSGTSTGGDIRCPPGTYGLTNDLTAAEDCTPCPAGSYCSGGSSSGSISGDCAPGYFCPVGTVSATSNPCPAGTYSSAADLYDASQCTPCEPGYFCPAGSTSMTNCPEGTYTAVSRTASADNSLQPSCVACPAGYKCEAAAADPEPCGLGYYSPTNSATCIECPAGFYCASSTTTEENLFSGTGNWDAFDTAGMCFNGTLCGARMMRPPDLTRDACPAGFYCPAGTTAARSCPSGTYNGKMGADDMTDCLLTPAGFYTIENATAFTGLCSPGHFCPAGSTSASEVPCPSRYYRLEHGAGAQRECSLCISGGYCQLGSVAPAVCPLGFYCPTGVSDPEPCRPGTFGNTTGLRDSSECTFCSPGMFCDGFAMTEPRGFCDPGYFCLFGSNTSTPRSVFSVVGLPNADECPKGSYCPLGTATPIPCPAGYYGPVVSATSLSDCLGCPAGYYCSGLGLDNVTGPCAAGYFCPGFASSKTQNSSEPGFYSLEGSEIQLPCLPGTYNNLYRQDRCIDCPAGYFCNDTGMITYVNNLCPAGSYCPEGSKDFQECPAGKYSRISGISKESQCVDCPPGMYCESPGSIAPTGTCSAGYYCIKNSRYPSQQNETATGGPCPPGSYCPAGASYPIKCPKGTSMPFSRSSGNVTFGGRYYYCELCPLGMACEAAGSIAPSGNCRAGYFCNLGAQSTTPTCSDSFCENMYGRCPVGSYCPARTHYPISCPNGTYTPSSGATSCFPCPKGSYCLSSIPAHQPCPQGYYCPAGTSFNWVPCPAGRYGAASGLSEADECLPCPQGKFCATSGLSEPTGNCSAGYYCPLSSLDSVGQTIYRVSHICPPGSYCPSGSGYPASCPKGTYNPVPGLMTLFDCVSCLGGKYCLTANLTSPSGDCDEGYYCKSGSDTPRPVEEYSDTFSGRTVGGAPCEKGAYCPLGSTVSQGCPAGTYNDQRGQERCTTCPSGYFCEANSTGFIGSDCPMGYYCPDGTTFAEEYPCPAGSFNNYTNGRSEASACILAPPGFYSQGLGNANPTGICDVGYYCPRGAVSATPACENAYCSTGGPCYPGVHCPAGTGVPTLCPGGMYCEDSSGLVTGKCLEGYYCVKGSHVRTPVNLRNGDNELIGDICLQGHFCPNASSTPVPCLSGTFSNGFGNTKIDDCSPCPPGFYCPNSATVTPLVCIDGSYCPIGSKTAHLVCDEGKYCPAGSSHQTDCDPGQYQDEIGQPICKECPYGSYCPRGTVVPIDCPRGSYCINSTRFAYEFLCPSGTFSNRTRLSDVSQCFSCIEGSYCETPGLSAPTGLCDIGYFCTAGSNTRTPDAGYGGDICPPGAYCPEGSSAPVLCPPGTNSTSTGLGSEDECGPCPKGFFCPDSGTVDAIFLCPGGYWCPGGVDYPSADLLCPIGMYCPEGTSFPIPCSPGSTQSRVGQDVCDSCPAGYYCLAQNSVPIECPVGHYCLQNTTFAYDFPCPPGYYVNTTRSESINDCKPCAPGQYCSISGLAESEGPCDSGYFCSSGSAFSSPFDSGVYGLGYIGETCVNLSVAGGSCSARSNGGVFNNKCPQGHWCPAGSSAPLRCPPGTNSSAEGLGSDLECGDCTKGFYCPKTGTVFAELPCQAGYFCPGGVANPADRNDLICPTGSRCPVGSDFPVPCEAGTYQDERGNDTCKLCPIGFFCEINSSAPILCPSGYYCPTASNNPREYPCPVGTYNPLEGLRVLEGCLECVEGSYCETPGLSGPTGLCSEGYYCGSGATTRAPVGLDGSDICTPGHYCPEGSVRPIPCPAGTNSTSVGLRSEDECGACTKGYYCPNVGTVHATLLCTGGYYCPGGVANPATNDTLICPPGHQCPEGSNLPLFCEAGTYQIRAGQTYCNPCAAGFYCQSALSGAEDCPAGYYCPEGTTYDTEFPCPVGTFSAATKLKSATECTPCSPGSFCETEGQTNTTGLCDAGYYCGGGSATANPFVEGSFSISYSGETCVTTDLETINNICPPGHYCPAASAVPIQCPPGTNSSSTGLQSIDDCQPCIKGYYCPLDGTVFSHRLCLPGYFCPGGVSNPALSQNLVCPTGRYCPLGSDFPEPCPPGQYQDEMGSTECKECPPGFYCEVGTITPVQCPAGHFCPESTRFPEEFPCVGGTFAPSTGYSECPICPEGNYCERAATDYVMCTLGDYCPAGTWIPLPCPNGTYGQIPGLSDSSQCTSCPGGRFCRGGIVSGVCAPGYFCRSGQSVPSPFLNLDGIFAPEDQLMFIETKEGAQCPPGHYCPENSTVPLACLNNTVRLSTHGKTPGDCGPCPGGYICYPGNPVPEPCAAGYYCPEGVSAIPCGLYTYNPTPAQNDPEACLPCPAGYYCDDTGLSTFTNHPCPIAHYCTIGTSDPSPCPAGTFRDSIGGASITDCHSCPAGHFCPRRTSVYYPCPKGTYCPEGSANTTTCPPGYFCPAITGEPQLCPENYYCPIGLGARDPIPCLRGTYCPAGTNYPNMCPLGSRAVPETNFTSSLLSSIATACEFCEPGTYGNDPARLVCEICLPGYVCLGSTTTPTPTSIPEHNGFLCPGGFYCPAGSFEAISCPAGTFQPFTGQSNSSACLPCASGFYQNEISSTACKRCSTSSTSEVGAAQCKCIGQNRAFQASDGWCVCQPGYEFVDFNFDVSTDSDGSFDCQPVVYDRCVDNEVRASEGRCDTQAGVCRRRCGVIGGEYSDVTGECECNDVILLNELCDETCRSNSRTVTCLTSGLVAIEDPTGVLATVYLNPDDFDALGYFSCEEAGSNVYYISTTLEDEFTGVFDSGAAFLEDGELRRLFSHRRSLMSTIGTSHGPAAPQLDRSQQRVLVGNASSRIHGFAFDKNAFDLHHRVLQDNSSNIGLISNPIVCINRMDSVVFDITNDVYPIYARNSLLNTNPLFDYGAFRDLAAHASSTSLVLSKFAFTFTESGTYVFSLTGEFNSKILIVVVTPDHIICPRYNESQFLESTASNLILLGSKANNDIVLSPDWQLILGLLVGMFLVVLVLICFLYGFRRRAWSMKSALNPKYRGKKDEKIKASKGGLFKKNKVAVINDEQDPEKADMKMKLESEANDLESALMEYSDDFEDEEPELGKQMQKHHDEIDRQMFIQKDLLNSLQETLVREVDELKNLLATTALELNSGLAGSKFKPADALIYRLRTELSNRELYERDVMTIEAKVLQCMESLQKLLKNGAAEMARNITDQIESSAIEVDKRSIDAFHRSADSIQSYTLHSVISELTSIEDFVNNSMIDRVKGENSRREKAETFFEQALKSSNFDLSQQIMDGINRCMTTEASADSTTNVILTAFTSFSGRTPRLVEVLLSTEKGLATKLLDIVGAGNDAAVMHEKEETREVFEIYLQQLSEALELLLSKIDPTLSTMRDCRDRSVGARTELIEILEYFRPSFAMNTNDIMPLIQKMRTDKEFSVSPMDAARKNLSVSINEREEYGEEKEDMMMTPRLFRVNSVKMIERSTSLSADQKHDLINRFANDIEIMENIVDIEKRRQQDAFKMAMEVQSVETSTIGSGGLQSPVHESGDVITRRHAAEKEELQRKLEIERADALNNLERKSSMDNSGDVFLPKTKMLASFIDTTYVIKLKQMAFSRKLEFAVLNTDLLKEKLSIRLEISNNVSESRTMSRKDSLNKEHNVLSNSEHLQKQLLDAAETRMIAERDNILQARSDKKTSWLEDVSSLDAVNTDFELEALRKDVDDEFVRLRELTYSYGEKRRNTNVLKELLTAKRSDAMVSELRTVTASCKLAVEVSADLTKKGKDLDGKVVEDEIEGLLEELNTLKKDIEYMLDYAFLYSPESNDARMASLVETMVSCYDHDFNLHSRSEKVVSFCDRMVYQCRALNECASADKFAATINDIKNNSSIKYSGAMQKKADAYNQTKKAEIERLVNSPYDCDMEAVILIERYSGSKVRRRISADAYFRTQLINLLDSLSSYQQQFVNAIFAQLGDDSAEDVSAYGLATDLKASILKMIDNQTSRCEFAIIAAYSSVIYEMGIAESHSVSILNGMAPNVKFADSLLDKSLNSEIHHMRFSSQSGIQMLRARAEISVYFYFKSEVKRMLALGRNHIDLVNMLNEVKALVTKSNAVVERLAIQNRDHFEKLLRSQSRDKKKFENEYHTTASLAYTQYSNEIFDTHNRYQKAKEDILSASDSQYVLDMEMFELGRRSSASMIKLQQTYRSALNDAFKTYSLSVETNSKVEDEMRAMVSKQNGLQLDFNELSHSCFVMGDLDTLRAAQENRRQQSELIRKQHQRELDGLLGELDHKKARSVEYLKNRLKLREKLRVKALVSEGLTTQEAVQRAGKEYQAEEKRGMKMIEQRIQEEERITQEVSNNDLSETVKRMKKEADNALQSLHEGFEAYSTRQRAALEKKLLKRRSKYAQEKMKNEGLSEVEALQEAEKRYVQEDETQRIKLQSVMKCFEADIQIKIDEESEDCIRRVKRAQALELEVLTDSLVRKKREQIAGLDQDLESYVASRQKELVADGKMSMNEAVKLAVEESKGEFKSRRLVEIESNYKLELRQYESSAAEFLEEQLNQIEEDKARMHVMLQKGVDEHCAKEIDSIHDSFANRKGVAINTLRADGKSLEAAKAEVDVQFEGEEREKTEKLHYALDRNKRKLTNCVNEIYDDILIAMKTENEKSLRGLRSSLELNKSMMVDALRNRLNLRQKDRKNDLLVAGLSDTDSTRRARLEYGTISEDQAALEARLDAEMREVLQAAIAAQDQATVEFEKFATDNLVGAEDNEAMKKFKEMIGVSDAMLEDSTTGDTVNDVQISTEEVLNKIDAVIAELRRKSEEDIAAIKNKYGNMIREQSARITNDYVKSRNTRVNELVKGGMTRTEAQRQAYDELHSQEEAALIELRDKLEAEMDLAIMARRRELEKKELKLVEDEFTKASIENNEASELNAEAKKLVEDLHQRYLNELGKARTELKSAQQNEIDELMDKLAARRAKHESKLAVDRVDAETRRKEFNRLALKEEEELSIMKRRHMEAERVQMLRLEEDYRQQMVAAEAIAKAREQSAAITAMREAALSAERDAKARSESETARREVARMRAIHVHEDKKLKDAAESQQVKGKEKLDDKLQRRRAKKEQDLKKEQDQKLAMLAAKQASEAAEAKAAQTARDVWMKKMAEVAEEAESMDLTGFSKESHIFKILLGERYVPKYQYDEFMKQVVGPRHAAETQQLLQSHCEERISCLKPVVSALLDEKNKARIDLLERLGEEKASDSEIMKDLSDLDSSYFRKQQQAEAAAIEKLEKHHVEEQIELRQRQLGEISAAVNLYEHHDKKSAKALFQDVSVQIAQFRAKLASETSAREEKMNQERIIAENKLKKLHEDRLREMQEKMEKEEETVARGIEKMKEDLFKKKDEVEKMQKEKAEEVNKENKERIMSAFEKEHEAALRVLENQRQDKKNKLKNRLAARRSSAMAAGEIQQDEADGAISPRGAPRRQTFNGNTAGSNRAEYLLQSVANPVKQDGEGSSSKKQWTASELSNPAVANSMRLIEEKLDRIDKVVTMLETNGGFSRSRAVLMNFDKKGVFMDPTEPLPGQELVIVPDESLSLQEMSRLKFGRTIMGMYGLHNYEMKVASSLPSPDENADNNATNSNPFRFSYMHDPAARVIYIHINRVSSSGDIGLIVTHAVSHVKVNPQDITNDANPEFITEFYTNLRILNQDLYKRLSLTGANINVGSDLVNSMRVGGGTNISDRSPTISAERGVPPIGNSPSVQGIPSSANETDKTVDDNHLSMPKKLKQISSSRSQTELTLMASLEKAREHIHLDKSLRGNMGIGDQGYFTNRALQERIRTYTKRGSNQAVPSDFFNRYMNEGTEKLDDGFQIGLQRYDSTSAGREEIPKRGGHKRRHSLGAGSFDVDTIQVLASGDDDANAHKSEGPMAAEYTPNKIDVSRGDSFRKRK